MYPYYDQRYTYHKINTIVKQIKACIKAHRFTISLNDQRQENMMFLQEYKLCDQFIRNILLNLKVEDFCHALHNTKSGYEHETLYVFVPKVTLYDVEGRNASIDVYLKFNLIEQTKHCAKGIPYLVVVSIHQKKKEIQYVFK